jgi:hypothetical protein
MTSDGETTKIKVVDVKMLYNFVVYNIFIWIHLGSQTINLNLVYDNMWGKENAI